MAVAKELTYETAADRYPRKRKGVTAKRIAKRRRAEGPVIKRVRAACVERDGYCRVCDWEDHPDDIHDDYLEYPDEMMLNPSQWAHLNDGTRAKTRNMAPDERHTTRKSLMLCKFHHDRLDGRQHPRIAIRELSDEGADGQLDIQLVG